MSKIIGIVTLYYPDIQSVAENILSYVNELERLILWENTPKAESKIAELLSLLPTEKTEFRTTGKNEGLGKPFNEAIRFAQQNGADYLLTMDQDSRFGAGDFQKYSSLVDSELAPTKGIFAPNRNLHDENSENFIEIRTAISSGALYPLNIFKEIGTLKDDFFVYMIDIEFCLRAAKNGIKTYCVTPIQMQHSEGYKTRTKSGLNINNYSAQSTYYIIRNTILTWKLYPEYTYKTDKRSFFKYKIIYRLLKLIFEKNRYQKMKAILLGLCHGYKQKSGQFEIK
jgi:rhamnosyltransferase